MTTAHTGEPVDGISAWAQQVRDYREAVAVTAATGAGGALATMASRIIDDLGNRVWTVTVQCMLCTSPVTVDLTVAESAQMRWTPRGICGKHGPVESG